MKLSITFPQVTLRPQPFKNRNQKSILLSTVTWYTTEPLNNKAMWRKLVFLYVIKNMRIIYTFFYLQLIASPLTFFERALQQIVSSLVQLKHWMQIWLGTGNRDEYPIINHLMLSRPLFPLTDKQVTGEIKKGVQKTHHDFGWRFHNAAYTFKIIQFLDTIFLSRKHSRHHIK